MRQLLVVLALCTSLQAAYTSRATVVIPAATGSTQTNITLTIAGSDNKLRTVGNGGQIQNTVTRVGQIVPADLILTSDAGCSALYTWGWDSYNATTGAVKLWLLMPTHSSGSSTTVYVCIGNATVVTYQGGAVGAEFDANTSRDWHFGDGVTLGLTDFTSNAAVLTNTNSVAAATGKIGGAGSYAAASSRELQSGTTFVTPAMTYEVWVNPTSFPNAYNTVLTNHGATTGFFDLHITSAGKLALYMVATGTVSYDGTGVATLTSGNWYHLVMAYDSSAGLTGYVNGVLDGSVVANGTIAALTGTPQFEIGQDTPNTPRLFDGLIDQVTVSSVARSANWVATRYANQNNPPAIGAFTSLSSSQGFVF